VTFLDVMSIGFSLSSVLNAYLKKFTKVKSVDFLNEEELELSDWAKKELKKSDQDIKQGYVSPRFDNLEEELTWLDDPNAKYINGRPVR